MIATRVLESVVVRAFATLRFVDGSTGDRMGSTGSLLSIPEIPPLELDAVPRGLTVLRRRGMATLTVAETSRIPGEPVLADLPPSHPPVILSGVVGGRPGLYLPRRFRIALNRGDRLAVPLYPLPGAVRRGGGGLLIASCSAPDGRRIPWALVSLTVTVPAGGVRVFRAQADRHGDVLLAPRRLPPLPQGVPGYDAILSVAAGAPVDDRTDPPEADLDLLPAARLRPLAAPGPAAATVPIAIVPGTVQRIVSAGAQALVIES